MADQFQNPQTTKLADKREPLKPEMKRTEQVAEKMAKKPTKTEQAFDQENSKPFSK